MGDLHQVTLVDPRNPWFLYHNWEIPLPLKQAANRKPPAIHWTIESSALFWISRYSDHDTKNVFGMNGLCCYLHWQFYDVIWLMPISVQLWWQINLALPTLPVFYIHSYRMLLTCTNQIMSSCWTYLIYIYIYTAPSLTVHRHTASGFAPPGIEPPVPSPLCFRRADLALQMLRYRLRCQWPNRHQHHGHTATCSYERTRNIICSYKWL